MKGSSSELQEISLASFLNDPYLLSKCLTEVRESFFDNLSYKLIYKCLVVYYKKYGALPTQMEMRVCVEEALTEDYGKLEDVLSSLDNLYSIKISSEDFVYEKIVSFVRRNRIEKSLNKAVDYMQNKGSVNLEELAEELLDGINGMSLSEPREFTLSDIGKLDEIKEEVLGNDMTPLIIKSYIDPINWMMQYKGFIPGTLNMVVAPPGRGKTTFLINQGLNTAQQGFNVLHIFLGDMSRYDGVIRYLSCLSGKDSSRYVNLPTADLKAVIKKLNLTGVLDNITVVSYAADELTVNQLTEEIVALQRRNRKHYHLIIVDYDENIRLESDSLYDSGGKIYNKLGLFAVLNKSVMFVASQPKPQYWDTEVIPLEGAAESSKKQKIIDLMLTIGKPKKNSKVGTLNIAKNRRGEDCKIVRLKFETTCARIIPISETEYSSLLNETL